MEIKLQKVDGFNYPHIPAENETIDDHINLGMLFPHIHSISYYLRSPRDCPLARGNWMLDLELKDGRTIAYKYPLEMEEKRFVAFLKPLLTKMHKEKTC